MATRATSIPSWLWALVSFLMVFLIGYFMYDVYKILRIVFFKMKASKSDVVNLDDMEEVTDDK